MNLGALVARSARYWGEREAVVDGDRSATFNDLERRSNQFADLMASVGVLPGDRVGVLIGNQLEWYDATIGLLKMGAIRTYINPRHAPAEIAYQVEDSGAEVVVASADLAPLVEAAGITTLRDLIVVDDRFEERLGRHDANRPIVDVAPEHPSEIRYTSGTTGRPKGAVHTHGSWGALGVGAVATLGVRPDDVLLQVGPMSHAAGGYALPFIASGARQVVHSGFDPIELVESVPRHKVTTLMLVPTMIYMLLDLIAEHGIDASTVRNISYGAAPMAPQRLERCLEILGPVFIQGYGMSEVLGGMTVLAKDEHVPGDPRLASCGRPSLMGELMVVDDAGVELPPGEEGEIVMRGPTRMKEYWNRPEATAEAIDSAGWFRSGDMARTDERGYVYIVDRKADMIVSGGFNVYPAEVEHALMAHPAVQEAAVIAVPDAKWGEAVRAVVRCREGHDVSGEDLITWAREQLAGYKVPKAIDFADEELPKNPTGKLLRRAVREPYWKDVDRQVG